MAALILHAKSSISGIRILFDHLPVRVQLYHSDDLIHPLYHYSVVLRATMRPLRSFSARVIFGTVFR
jgi:hypothetical protein